MNRSSLTLLEAAWPSPPSFAPQIPEKTTWCGTKLLVSVCSHKLDYKAPQSRTCFMCSSAISAADVAT